MAKRNTEKEIEKRHAALVAKRDAAKAADPTCDFGSVIEEMKRVADELADLPEDTEFGMEATDRLEELRHEAIRVKMEVEAIFELILGAKPPFTQ